MFYGILWGGLLWLITAVVLGTLWTRLDEASPYDDDVGRLLGGFVSFRWVLAFALLGAILGQLYGL